VRSPCQLRRLVRRGLCVRPVAGANAEAADVVGLPAAHDAVENDLFELALQVALRPTQCEGAGERRRGPRPSRSDRREYLG
jgi:hypothetical protein